MKAHGVTITDEAIAAGITVMVGTFTASDVASAMEPHLERSQANARFREYLPHEAANRLLQRERKSGLITYCRSSRSWCAVGPAPARAEPEAVARARAAGVDASPEELAEHSRMAAAALEATSELENAESDASDAQWRLGTAQKAADAAQTALAEFVDGYRGARNEGGS